MLQHLKYEKIDKIATNIDMIKNIKKTNKLFAFYFKNNSLLLADTST